MPEKVVDNFYALRLTDTDAERFHPNLHKDRTRLVYTWSDKGELDEADFGIPMEIA
jgi:hypothetical protein